MTTISHPTFPIKKAQDKLTCQDTDPILWFPTPPYCSNLNKIHFLFHFCFIQGESILAF